MNDNQDDKYNFLFDKLQRAIEMNSLVPLQAYNLNNLKKFDTKKILFNENRLKKVSAVFNHYIKYYITAVQGETNVFLEKYDLKAILKQKNKCFIYEQLMIEMGISLPELKNLMNLIACDEESVVNYYMTDCIKENNKKLEDENKKLREELETLRKQNKLSK
jgi:hypothetical protein